MAPAACCSPTYSEVPVVRSEVGVTLLMEAPFRFGPCFERPQNRLPCPHSKRRRFLEYRSQSGCCLLSAAHLSSIVSLPASTFLRFYEVFRTPLPSPWHTRNEQTSMFCSALANFLTKWSLRLYDR